MFIALITCKNSSMLILDIREQLRQVEKSVITKEPRFVFRVLRSLPNTRRRLNPAVLRRIILHSYSYSIKERDNLLNLVGGDDSLDVVSPIQRTRAPKQGASSPLPEVNISDQINFFPFADGKLM